MPSWRVETSLPCKDLKREDATGGGSRDRVGCLKKDLPLLNGHMAVC